MSRRHRGDHQVGDPTPRHTAGVLDRRADPAKGAGRFGVERDRVERALRALQNIGAPGPLRASLPVVTSHEMDTGRQFRERHCADRKFIGK
jgi:hypothetical protein